MATPQAAAAAFTTAGGNHIVGFIGLNPNGGDNTAFIDQVQIDPSVNNALQQTSFETPSLGPILRASEPPSAEAVSSGSAPNPAANRAAPQASAR